MEDSFFVSSPDSENIIMEVTPGHFTTNSSHVSHYFDMTILKHNASVAKEVAQTLAPYYISNDITDTIICMEGTEIIGAYLADELIQEGTMVMNTEETIYVVRPVFNVNGQLIFQNHTRELIKDKNVILLVSSVSSGKSIHRALDCLSYYGGTLLGISSLFAAVPEIYGNEIHSMFTMEDIPDYRFFRADNCDLCKEGKKLDAIVNDSGYTVL